MAKRYSKKQAIKDTIDLWKWLAKDGSRLKEDWPYWDTLPVECKNEECPCCGWIHIHNKECKDCPLVSLWNFTLNDYYCLDPASPYEQWWVSNKKNFRYERAAQFAKKIYQGAQRELRKLEKKT